MACRTVLNVLTATGVMPDFVHGVNSRREGTALIRDLPQTLHQGRPHDRLDLASRHPDANRAELGLAITVGIDRILPIQSADRGGEEVRWPVVVAEILGEGHDDPGEATATIMLRTLNRRRGPRIAIILCQVRLLGYPLHCEFDVSCDSTYKIALICREYSFTHSTLVRLRSPDVARGSQVR